MRNRRRRRFWPWRSFSDREFRKWHRLEELHQLDVKMDSRKAKRVRKVRRATWLVKVSAVVLTILSVSASVRWVYRQIFFENAEFRLNRLQIVTDVVLTDAEVAAAAQVEPGMNLMEIDLDEVREQIGSLPMVLRSEVVRELPDRLSIQVEERVPLAWLSCPPHGVRPRNSMHGFLVDASGDVFKCHKLVKRFLELPVIETMHMPKPAAGTKVESGPVRDAIELIRKSNALFEPDGLEIVELRLRNAWSLVARYNNEMEVVFGAEDSGRGLQDLRWIVSHAHAAGKELATVNLIPSKNIPVTFFNPPEIRAIPVPSPGPEKTAGLPRVGPPDPPKNDAENRGNQQLQSILNSG